MRQRCLFLSAGIFFVIAAGCGTEPPASTRQAAKGTALPVAPIKPTAQSTTGTTPAHATPKITGPISFEVKSATTQNIYSHIFGGRPITTQPKTGSTFLLVNVTVQNTSTRPETFSSPSFRIVDETGKEVDATFLGFGNTICTSGSMAMNDWSSISVGGETILKYKGRLDSNDPKNSRLDWELAPGKSHTATFMFVIPEQTKMPRFEVAK